MSAETQFYSLLSSAAGVTAIAGQRIYPDVLPEGRALPAVVYSRQATEPVVSIGSHKFGDDVTLSVACWAETREAADALAAAVELALVGTDFYQLARAAGFDPETGWFATTLTVQVFIVS